MRQALSVLALAAVICTAAAQSGSDVAAGGWDVELPVAQGSQLAAAGTDTSPVRLLAPETLTFPAFEITGTSGFSLVDAYVEDRSGLLLNASSGLGFQDSLLLGWLGSVGSTAGSGPATMRNVLVNTSCANVRALQELACGLLQESTLSRLQVVHQELYVPSWNTGTLTAANVRFTCATNASSVGVPDYSYDDFDGGDDEAGGEPLAACAVAHVSKWDALVRASRALQATAARVHIILDANISLPANVSGALGDQYSDGSSAAITSMAMHHNIIPVYRPMRVAAAPPATNTTSFYTYLSLGYIQAEGLWRMVLPGGSLRFEGITFVMLPLGPIDKYPMSILPWGMWHVDMDRCNPANGTLIVRNCTLIMQAEVMDYLSYWAGELLSVFPDRAAAAAWYAQDTSCDPPIHNRTLLNQKITLRDQLTWYTPEASVLGLQLQDVVLQARLPKGLENTPPGLQLTQLFDDPYAPFPDITWVATGRQLLAALATQATPNIMLLSNITMDPRDWPPEPITLTRDITIAGWPSRHTVLDWQRVAGVLDVGASKLKLRNLVTQNGGQGSKGSTPGWAKNLTMYLWPIIHTWDSTSLQLQSVTIVVPPSELAILRHNRDVAAAEAAGLDSGNTSMSMARSSSSSRGSDISPRLTSLLWLKSTHFTTTGCKVATMVDDGFLGFNITITTAAIAFPQLPLDVVLTVRSYSGSGDATHSLAAWKIAVPVAIGLMVMAIAGAMWARTRDTGAPCCPSASPALPLGLGKGGAGAWLWPGIRRAPRKEAHDEEMGSSLSTTGGNTGLGTVPTGGDTHGLLLSPSPAQSGKTRKPHPASRPGIQGLVLGWRGGHADEAGANGGCLPAPPSSSPGSDRCLLMPTDSPSTPSLPGQGSTGTDSCGGAAEGLQAVSRGSQDGAGAVVLPLPPPMAPAEDGGGSSMVDSFDAVPTDPDDLLINRLNMSRDLQVASAEPDVAQQLKRLVAGMQEELGDQEVQVTRVIGQGMSGVVYQGFWRGLTVAVKSLVFTALPSQPMSRRQQRAMMEAAICRTLQHPNIVATYSYDLQALTSTRLPGAATTPGGSSTCSSGFVGQGSTPTALSGSGGLDLPAIHGLSTAAEYKLFIIQEYCDGGTLRGLIDEGRLYADGQLPGAPPEPLMGCLLQLAEDIAAGMAHVHSRSIVHGDLTPSNVLLRINPNTETRYVAKVADFGLSWKLASGQEHVSNARQGTSFYISPEVLHVGIMSKAADVYSFGMLLHEMYHGTPAWRRSTPAGRAFMRSLAEGSSGGRGTGLDVLHWAPTCPAWLRDLITRCVAPDPKARPSFASILAELRGARRAWATSGPASVAALPTLAAVALEFTPPGSGTLPMTPLSGVLSASAGCNSGTWATGAAAPPGSPMRRVATQPRAPPSQLEAGRHALMQGSSLAPLWPGGGASMGSTTGRGMWTLDPMQPPVPPSPPPAPNGVPGDVACDQPPAGWPLCEPQGSTPSTPHAASVAPGIGAGSGGGPGDTDAKPASIKAACADGLLARQRDAEPEAGG